MDSGEMFTAPPDGLLASVGVSAGTMVEAATGIGEPVFGLALGIVDETGDRDLLLVVWPSLAEATAEALEAAGRRLRQLAHE